MPIAFSAYSQYRRQLWVLYAVTVASAGISVYFLLAYRFDMIYYKSHIDWALAIAEAVPHDNELLFHTRADSGYESKPISACASSEQREWLEWLARNGGRQSRLITEIVNCKLLGRWADATHISRHAISSEIMSNRRLGLPIGFALAATLGSILMIRNKLAVRRQHATRHECSLCSYDLFGNESGKCPECGQLREPTASGS